jgi:hypothetical protein
MGSEWILGTLALGVWIGFYWLRTGTVSACCECGDELSGSCTMELVRLDCKPCQYNYRTRFTANGHCMTASHTVTVTFKGAG